MMVEEYDWKKIGREGGEGVLIPATEPFEKATKAGYG